MIELKVELLSNGFVKHYAIDEHNNRYYIKQVETDIEYEEAIDVYPSKYTYVITNKEIFNA